MYPVVEEYSSLSYIIRHIIDSIIDPNESGVRFKEDPRRESFGRSKQTGHKVLKALEPDDLPQQETLANDSDPPGSVDVGNDDGPRYMVNGPDDMWF